jgi:hypothetical protein
MSKELNEYTMVFDRYEPVMGSLYNKVHCRNIRTSEGVLLQDHLCLEIGDAKKITAHLTVGEILIFSAELVFQQIKFKYPHEEMEVGDE